MNSAPALQRILRAVDGLRVRRLVADSRQVRPGDTFLAFPGDAHDGRDYVGQALARGAASVLWERRGYEWNSRWRVPNLGVMELRRRAGEIASHVYGHPSARLWMIGVTGTNGKTSCSQWIAQSLTRAGSKCAVIGTLGSGFPGALKPAVHTTPDAVWLHARLAALERGGARAVAMEASSHGLDQHRLAGAEFDVALLTNVTRDHLDYHGAMRSYRAAKARLFAWPSLKWAVLNLDDRFGQELVARAAAPGVNVVGYGFESRLPVGRRRRFARVQGRNLRVGLDGVSFDVASPWGTATVRSPVIGRFNAANLLGSLATLLASDMKLDASVAALACAAPVPGRTERFGGGPRALVVVDYAHTPDALEKILGTLRELLPSPAARRVPRLICVFGCGGERDRGKRPLMGRIAGRLADEVIVTSDNPRGEDPLAIISDIVDGTSGQCRIVPDRAQAIREAIAGARRGDVVLVAGKGHEPYQEIRGVRHRFHDGAVVRAALGRA